jgi:hypothetical protein
MITFTFEFEELPIVVEGGFEAGLVNGSALISIHNYDEWYIRQVFLDGSRKKQAAVGFDRKPIEIDRNSWLFLSICDQLESGRFKQYVDDAVVEELSACGDDIADQRREERREHSTLNKSQQGV